MDWRHIIAGGLLVVVALIGGSTFLSGNGATGAAIEDLSVTVILNDDFSGDIPQGTPNTCTGVGIPPDQLVVTFEGAVNDASSGWIPTSITYELAVRLGPHTATRTLNMSDGGYRQLNSFVTFPDEESFASGDRVTVNVSLRDGGDMVDMVIRTTPVAAQNLTCAEAAG